LPVSTIVRAAAPASRMRSSSSRWSTSAAAALRIASGWPAISLRKRSDRPSRGLMTPEATAASRFGPDAPDRVLGGVVERGLTVRRDPPPPEAVGLQRELQDAERVRLRRAEVVGRGGGPQRVVAPH